MTAKKKQKIKKPALALKYYILILIGITLICFSTILRNQFIVYDDPKYIVNNENLDLEGKQLIDYVFQRHLHSPHYKPLVYLSWAMEKKIVGDQPFLFFFNNLLLHLLNTFLVFWIVMQFIKRSGRLNNKSYLLAFIISLFWAIHPLKVESVAWAMERKDVLSGFFFLSSLLAYLYYLRNTRYIWMIAGAMLFGLGIISKSMVITLPVVLFLVDFALKRKWSYRILLEKIPYFIVLIIGFYLYGMFTRFQVHTGGLTEDLVPVANKSFNYITNSNILYRITFLSYRFITWISSIIYPHDLAVMYPFPEFIKKGVFPGYMFIYPVIVSLLLGVGLYFLKYSRLVLVAIIYFFITIFPVVNMELNESFVSDRYTYLPIFGFAIIFGLITFKLFEIKKPKLKNFLIGVTILYITFFGVSTFLQASKWKNGVTLFTHIINKYPDYGRAYMVRAGAREMDNNDLKGAIRDCDTAIKLGPDKLSKAYYDRGLFKQKMEDYKGALDDYNLAINRDPDYKEAYFNRGIVKNKTQDYNAAIQDFEKTIDYDFWVYESFYNIGSNYGILNDSANAQAYLRKCLDIKNDDPRVYFNMGLIYARNSNYQQAIETFDQLLLIDQKHAQGYYNRGMAKYFLNNLDGCCNDLSMAKKYGYKQAGEMIKKYCQ